MKHLFVLLAAVIGFAAPLSAQTQPAARAKKNAAASRSQPAAPRKRAAAAAPAPKDDSKRVYYYLTNISVTGSHIPLVVYRYKGRYYTTNSSSPLSVYGKRDIETTGSSDVGAVLRGLDPAIH